MKREAQKIVEAQLNDALNRNDSKTIREACIVLKALYDPEVDCQYYITKGLMEGKTKSEIIQELLEKVDCTEEEANKIYQKVENETKDLEHRLFKNPDVTEEVKTEVE